MSDINQLRNRIDEITIEMIKMLKMRTDISKEIWKWINLETWFREFYH